MIVPLLIVLAGIAVETDASNDPPPVAIDPLAASLPKGVQETYRGRYSADYQLWRVEIAADETTGEPTYDLTVFLPGEYIERAEGDRLIRQIQTRKLVIRQNGESIEEERHAIPLASVPKQVRVAYERKTREFPRRENLHARWYSEQKAGKERRLSVTVIFDTRTRFRGEFDSVGRLVSEKRTNY